jgi:hypothetical protein
MCRRANWQNWSERRIILSTYDAAGGQVLLVAHVLVSPGMRIR